MSSLNAPFSVLAHPYTSPVWGAVAYEMGNTNASNALIFVGGLTDGPHSIPYVRTVAKKLEAASEIDYSLFEVRTRSSFFQFGMSSLNNDVEDIGALVTYLRGIKRKKIVLLGHSTGCQDCMEYANYDRHATLPPLDGFVLQAPVSDRQSPATAFPNRTATLELANNMIAEGKAQDFMPLGTLDPETPWPFSAYRLNSLYGDHGDDDYFSTDIDDATLNKFWSYFKVPALVLHSGKDEYISDNIDQEAENRRYQRANPLVSKLSCVVPNATHGLDEPESQQFVANKLVEFLKTL